jgi:hypothetical protein
MSALTYKMVAKQYNATIRCERSSAYITLSKARVWVSEGWTVTITDDRGKRFSVSEFESRVSEKHPLPVSSETSIAPDAPMSLDAEAAVGEEPGAAAEKADKLMSI